MSRKEYADLGGRGLLLRSLVLAQHVELNSERIPRRLRDGVGYASGCEKLYIMAVAKNRVFLYRQDMDLFLDAVDAF